MATDGRYESETHSGGIRLTVPEGDGFELESESFSGGLRSAGPHRRRPGATGPAR